MLLRKLASRFCSEITPTSSAKKIDLIRTKPSLVLQQQPSPQQPASKLTPQQKSQLKLFIPTNPFNPRLSLYKQKQYLPYLTTELYKNQWNKLPTKIKILERIGQNLSLGKYVNLLYKDIYMRFLLSKNIGVEWNGDYSSIGVVNPSMIGFVANVYEFYLALITSNHLYIKKTPVLYSIKNQRDVTPEEVTIEIVKRIGNHILFEITTYGDFEKDFEILRLKNGKIYMLGFCDDLWKLLNMKAICLKPATQYMILKRENCQQYIVTSNEHYKTHKDTFSKFKLFKQSKVLSNYFKTMKLSNPLTSAEVPVILEIEGYDRLHGSHIYPVAPSHSISDYQRGLEYELPIDTCIDLHGHIKLQQKSLGQIKNIRDKNIQNQLLDYLKQNNKYFDLPDIFEEEIYISVQKEKLNIMLVDNLFVAIPETKVKDFRDNIMYKSSNFNQSKVLIPKADRILGGRQRRKFQKIVLKKLEEKTEYYSFEECMNLDEINISSNNKDTGMPIVVFQKRGKLVLSTKNKQKLMELAKSNSVTEEQLKKLNEPMAKTRIFYFKKSFIEGSNFLTAQRQNLKNVIIEPQNETQSTLQHILHMAAALQMKNFNLVKFHPTIHQSQKQLACQPIIQGVLSDKQHIGYGYEAFRMWIANKDLFKGDRKINQIQINREIGNATYIRKVFWHVLSILKNVPPVPTKQPILPFFDQFIMDHIDYYIINMEKAYLALDLSTAHHLTIDFFKNYLTQMYINPSKKQLINYFNPEDTKLIVFNRILELLAVVSPLMPFSSMHISSSPHLIWPSVNPNFNYSRITIYNRLLEFRLELKQRLIVNRMKNALVFINKSELSTQLEELINEEKQIALFLGVTQVTFRKPFEQPRFTIKQQKVLMKLKVYDIKTCYRCDPKFGQKQYLCEMCQQYLKEKNVITTQ